MTASRITVKERGRARAVSGASHETDWDRPGTYALLLRADKGCIVQIGRLGRLLVEPGFYVYVGSARGPGGLAARVGRHLRQSPRRRWHIDYLRRHARPFEVWWTCDGDRRECSWGRVMARLPGARTPQAGFGASDCRCLSHLTWFVDAPCFDAFRRGLQDACPRREAVRVAAAGPEGLPRGVMK